MCRQIIRIASVCQLQMTAAGTLACMLLAVPEAVQLAVKLSLAIDGERLQGS